MLRFSVSPICSTRGELFMLLVAFFEFLPRLVPDSPNFSIFPGLAFISHGLTQVTMAYLVRPAKSPAHWVRAVRSGRWRRPRYAAHIGKPWSLVVPMSKYTARPAGVFTTMPPNHLGF
ncbi:hypothetical protein B0H17DRAFT_1079227 [Mycena rosella]|uniref:Uncharacterized protein n=1 Tax=Mycena rosella TaxID=1033263 RepID=A0AAD7D4B8_MYCRO|nr:hypothetical protein B0H17DRAFT_1079227 [Mycena rosella]